VKFLGGKRVIAVDFGNTKIRVAELERHGNRILLTYYDELESPLLPPEERENFIREKRRDFFRKLPTKNVYFSLPGRGVLVRTISVPAVPLKKLKDILKYEVQQQIPFPLEIVSWTYQILTQTPQNFNILLAAAKKDLINEHLSKILPMGVNIEFLDTDLFALINIFTLSPQFKPDKCQAILEMGALSSNFIIMHEEKFLIRSLTNSGDTFTSAIMEHENISFEDAEKKKYEQGTKHPSVISTIESLHTEIQNSIDYWRFTLKGPEVEEVYLCGRGTSLLGFREILESKSRIKTFYFDPLANIEIPEKYSGIKERGIEFGVLFGIALRNVLSPYINLDFLPVEVARIREFRENRPYIYLSSLMAILLSLTPALFMRQEKIMLNGLLNEIKISLKQYERYKPDVERLNEEINKIKGKVGVAKNLIVKKSAWLRRILEIGESLPSSRIYLTKLSPGEIAIKKEKKKSKKRQPPPEGKKSQEKKKVTAKAPEVIGIKGEVLITDIKTSFEDFKKFIKKLSQMDFVSSVSIAYCEIEKDKNKLVFALNVKLK